VTFTNLLLHARLLLLFNKLYCIIHCCLPKDVMDDWKLKTTTVVTVRIERPNKTFVHFVCLSVCLFVFETSNSCWLNYSHRQFYGLVILCCYFHQLIILHLIIVWKNHQLHYCNTSIDTGKINSFKYAVDRTSVLPRWTSLTCYWDHVIGRHSAFLLFIYFYMDSASGRSAIYR